jgi:hypothetical protein
MKRYQKIIMASIILVFLSAFRMGDYSLPISFHQTSDWNTYTVKEINFSLPASYQVTEPNEEFAQLILESDDVDSVLFFSYELNEEENYASIFTITDRYKPELFDLKSYMAQREKYLDDTQSITYHDQSFFHGYDSVAIEGKTFYKDAGWFTDKQYVLVTDKRIYDIRITLISSDHEVTHPHLDAIIQSIRIIPDTTTEKSPFSPFCMIGLGLIVVLLILNIWLRRKKKNALHYPSDYPKNL